MKTKLVAIYLAAVILSRNAVAQSKNLESGSINFGGSTIHYVTVTESTLPTLSLQGYATGSAFNGKEFHRWLLDKTKHLYFGYDLLIQPISGTSQCQVSVLPLSLSLERINQVRKQIQIDSSWKLLQLPSYPVPKILQPDDTVALDLLISPDGKQKVVDYVQPSCPGESVSMKAENNLARDLTLENLPLDIVNGSLYVNGQPVSGTPKVGSINSPIPWFYFPGKGRFLISIAPHEGYQFVKAGTIQRNRIEFDLDGSRYEVRASHPIVGNGGIWSAYVLFDSAYQANGENAEFGGSDRMENILHRQ